ncbi:hypothetical protein CDAR_14801 [Caerostris darwini]|uniref:Uncharacterized protein n=1 Tax=Caerostris darwini TaxID=1538125 RepID=A0AAV4W740_9ARAC|nr:hypothetical protein CDAR_14801 [Caerostris darwini]
MVPRSALKNKEVGMKEEICPLHPAIDPPFHSHLSSATPPPPHQISGWGGTVTDPPSLTPIYSSDSYRSPPFRRVWVGKGGLSSFSK